MKKDDKDLTTEGWEMLERNFEKTTSLVKDFLSFSKGRLPQVKLVNPNDLVKEIVELYKDIAEEMHIKLNSDLDANMIRVPLDPEGIHTCLTNLVSNAIDACQLSENKDSMVTIGTEYDNGLLRFEVRDNGSGMDYDVKQKVFTTFFTTKGGKGTGLGLLTTRKIVQEHGGKISVRSVKGKGTTFRMTFPRKRLIAIYNGGGKKSQVEKGT